MITVIARWENFWSESERGLLTEFSIWEQVFLCYKVNRVIFVPIQMKSILEQYDTFEEALAKVSGKKVFLEKNNRAKEIEREPIYLESFKHPVDVVYIFGNTSTDNSRWVGEDDILLSVRIPYNYDMYGLTVLGIVLNDREMKSHDNRQ